MLFSCQPESGRQTGSAEAAYLSIRGWNILSDHRGNAIQVIDAASAHGINHLQLSHHIIHDLMEIREPARQQFCNELIDYAHQKGIEEVVVWDHALYDLDYYPAQFRTGPDGTIDLDNPAFWDWLKEDYRAMLDLIPQADGIILTFIETGARTERQYSQQMGTAAEKLAKVIDAIADVVIEERKMKLYARTFKYTREELSAILDCIRLIENEEVILMVKEVPHDFFLTHPVQSYIDQLGKPVLIEFDAVHEYNGQGIIATTFVETIAKRWKYYQQQKNVIGYVARTDRYGDTKIIGRPSEILLHALTALNRDPGISNDQIYIDFIVRKYGEEALPHVLPAFKNAFDIVSSSIYTLGLCMANHSTLSCDYRSIYTRYVSGRWMDDPVVNIPHGVDLATSTLAKIEDGQADIEAGAYPDLYHTFYRTLVKARLSRGTAKAYFSYRLWFSDAGERSQELLDLFWEGIDEMDEMAAIVSREFGDSPRGGWSWEEDLETVSEYTQWMTQRGWDDYGGKPIEKRKF